MALILSRADAERCLDMTEAIEAMRLSFDALSAGKAPNPQRMAVGLARSRALLYLCHRYYRQRERMPLV